MSSQLSKSFMQNFQKKQSYISTDDDLRRLKNAYQTQNKTLIEDQNQRRIDNILNQDLLKEGKVVIDEHNLKVCYAEKLHYNIKRQDKIKLKIFKRQKKYWQNYPDKAFGDHMLSHMRKQGHQCFLLGVITGHGDNDVDQINKKSDLYLNLEKQIYWEPLDCDYCFSMLGKNTFGKRDFHLRKVFL